MPVDFSPLSIFVIAVSLCAVIFYSWFLVSTKRTQAALDALIASPEQISDIWRMDPDGDGYDRLYVRAKSGALLVIGHFDADAAERRLLTACAEKAARLAPV